MNPELEEEFPFWRFVLDGFPYSEVDSWTLDTIRKMSSLGDWKADHDKAFRGFDLVKKDSKK